MGSGFRVKGLGVRAPLGLERFWASGFRNSFLLAVLLKGVGRRAQALPLKPLKP